MEIKKTLTTLALAGTAFAGTLFAEPYSDQSSVGFPKDTNVIIHLDYDAIQNSQLGKYCTLNADKFQGFGQDQQYTPEDKAFFDAESKKITSMTVGVALENDDDEIDCEAAVVYMRGNGIKWDEYFERVKKYTKAQQLGQEVLIQKQTLADKNCQTIVIKQNDKQQIKIYFVTLSAKTTVLVIAEDDEDATKALKKLLKNRERKIGPKITVKIKNDPMLFVYGNGENIKNNGSGLKQLLFTMDEQNNALNFKIDAKLADTAQTQQFAQEATQNLQGAAMLLTMMGGNEQLSNAEKQGLNLLAKSVAGTVIKNSENVISGTASVSVPELTKFLDAATGEKLWEKYLNQAQPLDDSENVFIDADDDMDDEIIDIDD